MWRVPHAGAWGCPARREATCICAPSMSRGAPPTIATKMCSAPEMGFITSTSSANTRKTSDAINTTWSSLQLHFKSLPLCFDPIHLRFFGWFKANFLVGILGRQLALTTCTFWSWIAQLTAQICCKPCYFQLSARFREKLALPMYNIQELSHFDRQFGPNQI